MESAGGDLNGESASVEMTMGPPKHQLSEHDLEHSAQESHWNKRERKSLNQFFRQTPLMKNASSALGHYIRGQESFQTNKKCPDKILCPSEKKCKRLLQLFLKSEVESGEWRVESRSRRGDNAEGKIEIMTEQTSLL